MSDSYARTHARVVAAYRAYRESLPVDYAWWNDETAGRMADAVDNALYALLAYYDSQCQNAHNAHQTPVAARKAR